MRTRLSLFTCVALTLIALVSGCSGSGTRTETGGFGASVSVQPETATLAPGQQQVFSGGAVEIGVSTQTWGVQEANGGTVVTTTDLGDTSTVTYTAPTQTGKYHILYVVNAGSSDEHKATATVVVK